MGEATEGYTKEDAFSSYQMKGNFSECDGMAEAEEDDAFAEFHKQVINFFSRHPIHECLPEASKLLVLDNRIAITVAARALEQYHRPFGCVLNLGVPALTNIFDGYELISFIIHVYNYYTDAGYVKQLHDALLQSVLDQPDADLASALTDAPNGRVCRDAISRDIDKTLALLPNTFALKDLETVTSTVGICYADFLASLLSSSPTSLSVSDHDVEQSETTRADSESLRKRIELLFPPPWDYTLEKWHKLNGREAQFPHLSMRYSLKDALDLLLETQEPRVIAWDDSRGTPFSFVSFTSALGHFVQNFCGSSPIFSKLVLSELDLGIGPDTLVVVPETAPFSHVLQLLRNRRWSAVPLVKQNGSFLGLLSVSQICFLFLGCVEGRQTKWSWTDTVGFIWENLVQTCATHPATATHTYHNRSNVTRSTVLPPSSSNFAAVRGDKSTAASEAQYTTSTNSYPGRPQITSKLGGAFLAKLGDYAGGKRESENYGSMTNLTNELERPPAICRAGAELPSSLAPPAPPKGMNEPIAPKSPKMTAQDETSNAATAVQALIRNITCSAAVTDDDLTLKQVITHIVLTDDRRVIFLDPETHRIRSYITPRRLFQFLMGELKL